MLTSGKLIAVVACFIFFFQSRVLLFLLNYYCRLCQHFCLVSIRYMDHLGGIETGSLILATSAPILCVTISAMFYPLKRKKLDDTNTVTDKSHSSRQCHEYAQLSSALSKHVINVNVLQFSHRLLTLNIVVALFICGTVPIHSYCYTYLYIYITYVLITGFAIYLNLPFNMK